MLIVACDEKMKNESIDEYTLIPYDKMDKYILHCVFRMVDIDTQITLRQTFKVCSDMRIIMTFPNRRDIQIEDIKNMGRAKVKYVGYNNSKKLLDILLEEYEVNSIGEILEWCNEDMVRYLLEKKYDNLMYDMKYLCSNRKLSTEFMLAQIQETIERKVKELVTFYMAYPNENILNDPDIKRIVEDGFEGACKRGDMRLITLLITIKKNQNDNTFINGMKGAYEGGKVEVISMLKSLGVVATKEVIQSACKGGQYNLIRELIAGNYGLIDDECVRASFASGNKELIDMLLENMECSEAMMVGAYESDNKELFCMLYDIIKAMGLRDVKYMGILLGCAYRDTGYMIDNIMEISKFVDNETITYAWSRSGNNTFTEQMILDGLINTSIGFNNACLSGNIGIVKRMQQMTREHYTVLCMLPLYDRKYNEIIKLLKQDM